MDKRNTGIVCLIMSASAFVSFFGPFISINLSGVRIWSINGFELAFDLFSKVKEGEDAGLFASAFALIALFETISTFFYSLSQVISGGNKQAQKVLAYERLAAGIIVLILSLTIISVSEYDGIAHLGFGAIVSGLLILIANIMLFVSIKSDNSDEAVKNYLQSIKTANNSNSLKRVSIDKALGKEAITKEHCDICNRKTETLHHVIHTSDKMAEAEKYVCDECLKEYNCRLIEEKANGKTDDKEQGSYMGGWIVCPNCGKLKKESESFCGHCGKDFSKLVEEGANDSTNKKINNQPIGILNDWITCPNCGKIQRADKSVCWNCGKSIIDNTQGEK